MSHDAVNILGINITISSKKEILELLQKYLIRDSKIGTRDPKNGSKTLFIATPNPEQIVYAAHDSHFSELLNRADVTIPDGVGVVWASRILSKNQVARPESRVSKAIPGVDFMENLVELAFKQRVPVALIGSRSNLALKALDCLREAYPGLQGVAMDAPELHITSDEKEVSGIVYPVLRIKQKEDQGGNNFQYTLQNTQYTIQYTNEDDYFKNVADVIQQSGARIIFVGLGAPKQEYFIEALSRQLSVIRQSESRKLTADGPVIFMSVGGSFDEIAGRIARAPKWVSRAGLKWLWRLILEPWRIKRQLALVTFVWMVISRKLRGVSEVR